MVDYKIMYIELFNAVTNAINILQKAQIEAEEKFLSQDETQITILKTPDNPR